MTTKPTNKILIKKLPGFSTVWHEASHLVFKSAKELVVIGKLVDKEIVALTESDIKTCDEYKFKYEIEEEEEEEVASGEETAAVDEVEEEVTASEEEVTAGGEEAGEVEEASGEEEEEVVVKETVQDEPVIAPLVTRDDFTDAVGRITTIWSVTNSQYKSQIQDLENDLDKTRNELSNLQDMYDKMKVKFDGIRQLFSV